MKVILNMLSSFLKASNFKTRSFEIQISTLSYASSQPSTKVAYEHKCCYCLYRIKLLECCSVIAENVFRCAYRCVTCGRELYWYCSFGSYCVIINIMFIETRFSVYWKLYWLIGRLILL